MPPTAQARPTGAGELVVCPDAGDRPGNALVGANRAAASVAASPWKASGTKCLLTRPTRLLRSALLIRSRMKTFLPKQHLEARKWHVVDADGAVLGHLAEKVAVILRGKNKAVFTPHLDTGDFVVVINAEKVVLTGKKETQKTYMTYSGWKGGEKFRTVAEMRRRNPAKIIENAVWGMLPKGRLGRQLITKLKVYKGAEHPHDAQTPATLAVAA